MTVKPFSRLNYAPRNYNIIAATMVPVYNVSASSSSINEGTAVTYTITTQYVLDGTILYWTTSGTTVAADFSDGVTSGSVTMTNGTATVVRTLTSDVLTEGAETIVFELRTVSTSGTIVASTPSGTVNDVSVLTITPSTSSVNEGSSVTWTISAIGFGTGTLYYTNSGTTTGSDFSDGLNSGSIAITADSGTLTKTLLNDLSTEGSETIIIQIRTGSTSGTVVGTSNTVTVADTSYSSQAYSVKFNGSSQYLSVPTTFNVRTTTSWTMEGWWYLNSTSNPILISGQTSGTDKFYIQFISGTFYVGDNTSNPITASYTFTTNNWYHIAVVNNNGTLNAYINGRLLQSVSNTLISNAITVWRIGSRNSGPYYINGNISNIRIVSDVAVYTANFNPPTDNLSAITGTSLLINGATISDSSINSATITNNNTAIVTMENPFGDYSTYFPSGAGSNYVVPHSSSLDFGTGDFTIEFWMYAISMPNAAGIIGKKADDTTNGWQITYNSTYPTNRMSIRLTQQIDVTSTSSWTLNVWDHWAVTRSGTTVSWFKNGVLDSTATNSSDISEVRSVYIGYSETWGGYFTGYLSNIRVVKGTALYPWIPATTALTTTSQNATASQVSLLTAQSATIIDNGNGGPGQPTYIATSTYGVGINATSQNLNTSSSNAFAFGTGDFTVEFWIYWISSPSATGNLMHTNVSGTGFCMYWNSTQVQVSRYLTAADLNITYSETAQNTWVHYAAVRRSGTMYVYRNGVLLGSGAVSTSYTQNGFYLFSDNTNTTFNGYITNVRVVKGLGVYTGAFTPSGPLTSTQSAGTNIAAITGTSTSLLTLQDATFVDNSTNAFTITATGSPTISNLVNLPITNTGTVTAGNSVIPFASTYSYQFNGSSQYLTVPANAAFAFGTGDFTVECWVYITTALTGGALIGPWTGTASTSAWIFTQGNAATSYLRFGVSNGSTTTFFEGTGGLTTNQWIHVAAVRTAGTIKLYSNGVQVYSGAATQNISVSSQALQINGVSGATFLTTGYMSNIRVVKGSALYSSNFIPSTSALTAISGTSLLTCQYSEIMDGSTNHATITAVVPRPNNQNPFGNYYASFNGSSQYLTVPSNAGFAFGTGDFTIEFWVYPTVNVRQDWFDLYLSSASSRLLIYYDGTNIIYYNYITAKITGSAMTLNAWQHIALVRLSGNTKLYINGTQSGSTATDTFSYVAQPLFIGKDGAGSTYVTGYITNVRVVKGVAVYTGTFTPPTTPLNNTQSSGTNISAITGTSTSLLTCQYANIVDASTNVLSITNNGSIKTYLSDLFSGIVSGVNYAQKNYSLSLNGSSQYVTTASSVAATGNFTVECWVYATAYTTNMGIWSIGSTEAAGRYELYLASSYTLTLDQYTAGGPTYGTISPNTWYHIALVRSGSTLTMYINGTARSVTSGSATLSGTIGGTNGYVIGKTTYGPNAPWSGYISNFRYASVAVYTGAFTPSTTPLKAAQSSGTNIAAITTQTNILACQYNTLFDASTNKLAITKTGSPDMVNVYPFPA